MSYLAELGGRLTPSQHNSRRAALRSALEAIRMYEQDLAAVFIKNLLAIPGITIYGITDPMHLSRRTPTVALRLSGRTPQEMARSLGKEGMFTWAGNYYAISLTERLGLEATGGMLRLGLVHYNTSGEVERVVQAVGGQNARD
jgi:selenocysteine lyase/cysteine desulfurase